EAASCIGVGIARRIGVVQNDDSSAAKLLAVFAIPFRFVGAGTERAARCRDSDGPQVVDVLLALDDRNLPVECDGLVHFVDAVKKRGVDALRIPYPATPTIGPTHAEARFVALWVTDLMEERDAVSRCTSKKPPGSIREAGACYPMAVCGISAR